jgi:hypothetical protein
MTPSELEADKILNGITTLLSFVGTSFALLSYKCRKSVTPLMTFVMTLIFFELLYCVSNILSYFDNAEWVCYLEGFLRYYSSVGSVYWATVIQIVNYYQLKSPMGRAASYYRFYLLILGIPLLVGLLVLISGIYGGRVTYANSYGFCLTVPVSYSLMLAVIPMSMLCCVCLAYCIKIISRAKQFGYENETKHIFIFPVILLICTIPALAQAFISWFEGYQIYPLVFIQILLLRLKGFFSAIAYARNVMLKMLKGNSSISIKSSAYQQDESPVEPALKQALNA